LFLAKEQALNQLPILKPDDVLLKQAFIKVVGKMAK